MKPLVHPAARDITVEGILHALSDSTRVAIFARIAGSACPATCSSFLVVKEKPIPKSTLSQHFKMLREAGLIRSERVGVELQNTSRCLEVEQRFPGLIPAIVASLNIQWGASGSKRTGTQRTARPKATLPSTRRAKS